VSGGAREVLLVRHAETEWSLAGRHTGRTDIPLTDRGRATAGSLRARIEARLVDHVLTSPSTRARETCRLSGLADRAENLEDLLEWDYGDYEGLTTAEIRRGRPDWNQWRDGCPGGEDAADVGARADRVIARLHRLEGVVAIFSHGHLLRVLGARWIELAPEAGGRLGLSTGAISVLAHERESAVLSLWNDTGSRRHPTPAA
jgi:probable phosphoglycerate mutase